MVHPPITHFKASAADQEGLTKSSRTVIGELSKQTLCNRFSTSVGLMYVHKVHLGENIVGAASKINQHNFIVVHVSILRMQSLFLMNELRQEGC